MKLARFDLDHTRLPTGRAGDRLRFVLRAGRRAIAGGDEAPLRAPAGARTGPVPEPFARPA